MAGIAASVDRDLAYGADEAQRLDVYHRAGDEDDATRAAIVLVHGGGWFRGDKAKEQRLAGRLAAAGWIVFVPNYREAPAAVYPASRDDVLAAAAWAVRSPYAFDRDRVAFVGGSAGGNLAVEAALATARPAASWSGIFGWDRIIADTDGIAAVTTTQDLDALKSADINQTGPDDAFLRWTILQEVGQDRALLAEASTTHRVTDAARPVFLANSLHEFVPVSDPVALQAAYAAAGVASTLLLLPGTRHAEGYFDDAIDPTLTFLRAILA